MRVPVGELMLSVVLVLTSIPFAYSLHEVDHRYDVTGYILDADRQPLDGVPVVAHVDGKRMGSGSSDSNGYFRFRMHLHDSDIGRELRLKTPEFEGTVRVTLTPGDSSTERIHHVNFIDGKLVEGELPGRGGVPVTMLGVAAAATLLIGGFLVAEKVRRQRRRRQRAAQQAESARSGKASKGRKGKNRKRRR
ncbi:MAG: hypothetical protein GWN21_16440 [Gammaproteobacteria bacterium]|nr:carboxypeptidase regulatory-like domain-containing protein [Gammaproteobacteria bacterium]NIP90351.1 carboxypeptidase regulatory-like domain-containing protein [Gammaproteobacteria bacterium]NIR22278.1 carboxypeptidase regulatory-like domain-containing protein [Gammaproteobacteria bacterium]NIS03916.1 carboxypeptidase regulatory-like domain-containing protein [Gammaproteobacteria bacterium]NIU42359.1 hypothetical protein [Gammaproteobacteria bacterium]